MEEKDQLSGEYQGQKLQIIFSPDTVIEPFAVVVKQLNTTITFPTMKWVLAYTSLADVTEILEVLAAEWEFIFYCLLV